MSDEKSTSPIDKTNISSKESPQSKPHDENEEVGNESSDRIPEQEKINIILPEMKVCSFLTDTEISTQILSFTEEQSLHTEEITFVEHSVEVYTSEETCNFDLISSSDEPLDYSLASNDPSIFKERLEQHSYQEAIPLCNSPLPIQTINYAKEYEFQQKDLIILNEPQPTPDEFREQSEAKLVASEVWHDMFDTFWTFNGEREPKNIKDNTQWLQNVPDCESNVYFEDKNTHLQNIALVIDKLQALENKILEEQFSINVGRQSLDSHQNKKIENMKWQNERDQNYSFYEKRNENKKVSTHQIQSNIVKKVKFNLDIETPIATSSNINQSSNLGIIDVQNNENPIHKSLNDDELEWQLRFKNHFSIIEKREFVHYNEIKEKWNNDYKIRCNMQLKPAIFLTTPLEKQFDIPILKQEIVQPSTANVLEWESRFNKQCLLYKLRSRTEENILKEQWKRDIQLRLDMKLTPAIELHQSLPSTNENRTNTSNENSINNNEDDILQIESILPVLPASQNIWPDSNVPNPSFTPQILNQDILPPAYTPIDLTSTNQSSWLEDNDGYKYFQDDLASFEQLENDAYNTQIQKFIADQIQEVKETTKQYKEIENQIMSTVENSTLQLISDDQNMIYLHMLSENDEEYTMLFQKFHMTTERKYEITRIATIVNPYLNLGYSLRKLEYITMYGEENVRDMIVFRGLRKINDIKYVMIHNWNWRQYVEQDNQPYGKGVTFSSMAKHAIKDCDGDNGEKMMASASIIVTKADFDNNTLEMREPIDQLFSKFRDDEFCPRHIVYFI